MIGELLNMVAVVASMVILVYLFRILPTVGVRNSTETDEETWEYCTLVVDPEMPMKHYDSSYIPMEYRWVLEQDSTGSYRYRPLSTVLSEVQSDESMQEVAE